MDELITLINHRLDDHMQQLRELTSKYGEISKTQAVFCEHQKTIKHMYGNIQTSIGSLKEDIQHVNEKVEVIQEKQKDLERIEIRRAEIWEKIIQNKTWAIAALSLFIFSSYQFGAYLLNHEPPGKKSIPIELYSKVMK